MGASAGTGNHYVGSNKAEFLLDCSLCHVRLALGNHSESRDHILVQLYCIHAAINYTYCYK